MRANAVCLSYFALTPLSLLALAVDFQCSVFPSQPKEILLFSPTLVISGKHAGDRTPVGWRRAKKPANDQYKRMASGDEEGS